MPEDYRYTLTREWEPPYRFERIEQLLGATAKHSLASFKEIQTDIVDSYAVELKRYLIAAAPFPGADAAVAGRIPNWDGAMNAGRPEPLIFSAWARALARRTHGDELGVRFASSWVYRTEST